MDEQIRLRVTFDLVGDVDTLRRMANDQGNDFDAGEMVSRLQEDAEEMIGDASDWEPFELQGPTATLIDERREEPHA